MQEFNTEYAARCLDLVQQDENAMAGGVIEYELLGRAQRCKRLQFDEIVMLTLNSFAREVAAPSGLGLGDDAVYQELDDKAHRVRCTQRISERRGQDSDDFCFVARGSQQLY